METSTDTPDTTPTAPDHRDFARWVRVVDRALWRERAAALAADDIRPREARLLHALASDRAAEVLTRLRHLPHGGKSLRRLAQRGWIAENDGTWSLTDAGRTAADGLSRHADELGARLREAVAPDDLTAASATLEAVARTLGWQEGDAREGRHPHHRGGFGPRGHRFGPHRHGFGPGGRGFGPGFRGDAERGADGHHDRSPRHRDAESASERGFAAGFTEGRTAASA